MATPKPSKSGKSTNSNNNISNFLDWVNRREGGHMLYRGASKEGYEIEASISRRFPSRGASGITASELLDKSKELVEEARNSGHASVDQSEESDLQLLARLQHYGAATCLIDFTSSPLVALWFACREHPDEVGKIVAFDAADPDQCRQIKFQESQESISNLLLTGKDRLRETPNILLAWEPLHQEPRIGPQQSVFVFGTPVIKIDDDNTFHVCKDGIIDELRRKYGISEDSLFNDFYGFASINAQSRKYPILSGREHYDTAQRHRAERNYEEAIRFYIKAREKDNYPNYKDALYGLARAQAGADNHEEAIGNYKQFLQGETSEKKQKDAWYYLGVSQVLAEHFADAIQSFSEAIAKSDLFAEAFYGRGFAKAGCDKFQDAIEDYDEAIRINPEYARAFLNRGVAKDNLGDSQGAVKDYDEGIRINSGENSEIAEAFYNRAFVKTDLGDFEGAIKDYDDVIRINPKNADAFYNRGNAKMLSGDFQKALKDYDEAIRINPKDADAFNDRGNAKIKLGNIQDAFKDYEESIRLNPKDARAFLNRGNAKIALRDIEGATKDYDEAIRINPEEARAFLNRGNIKMALHDFQNAIKDYNEAIRINPEEERAFVNRGNAKMFSGDFQDALKDYNEAIRINPQFAGAFLSRGNAKSGLQDFQGALKDYDEAIRINPADTDTPDNLGISIVNLGNLPGTTKDDEIIHPHSMKALAFLFRAIAKHLSGDKEGAWGDAQKAKELAPSLKIPEPLQPPPEDN